MHRLAYLPILVLLTSIFAWNPILHTQTSELTRDELKKQIN